jgi:hypothetical protein
MRMMSDVNGVQLPVIQQKLATHMDELAINI